MNSAELDELLLEVDVPSGDDTLSLSSLEVVLVVEKLEAHLGRAISARSIRREHFASRSALLQWVVEQKG